MFVGNRSYSHSFEIQKKKTKKPTDKQALIIHTGQERKKKE